MFATLDAAVGEAMIPVQSAEDTDSLKPVASTVRPALLLWNDIRGRAYEKWLAAGSPSGDCVHFWLAAEQELQRAQ